MKNSHQQLMRPYIYLVYSLCVCAATALTSQHSIQSLKEKPKIFISDVTAQILSEKDSAPSALFGPPRNLTAGRYELKAGKHPRIVFSKNGWEAIVNFYSDSPLKKGSWSKYILDYTRPKGPANNDLNRIAALDTSAYTGEKSMNSAKLKFLAETIQIMSEYNEGGLFMYALHVIVDENRIFKKKTSLLQPEQNITTAVNLITNFAKVVLSHYATYGCAKCEYVKGIKKSDLWNKKRLWSINIDWHTGGLGMALSYDVLFNRFTREQRKFVRSALALLVSGRQHWGTSDDSTDGSPNAMIHPHRIFSNWATYHANLHLTNLAFEGETEFDNMTSALGVRYNKALEKRTIALYDAFITHSIYPDGSSFEDGYVYNLGMREGSLMFLALARRGYNHIDTPRFRNFIYNGAQMMEPYHCGEFIGHSSGGGHLYPTWQALVRYAYPHGELPTMLWYQRMGTMIAEKRPCRIGFHQIMMQMSILGCDHSSVTRATSPVGLSKDSQQLFGTSMYAPRRGLLVARSSLSENSIYLHFDARPDAFIAGHDNADRGVFTISALRRKWVDDIFWRRHESQLHSLMHVNGQAQALKAPSVRMLKVKDYTQVVLAAADLTYAYNVQWARAFQYANPPKLREIVFENGRPMRKDVSYTRKETCNPRDLGWPADDPATDLGFTNTTSLWGEYNLGFSGFFNWKRQYRKDQLLHAVRSIALVRMQGSTSYVIVGDDFAMEGERAHTFDSYIILAHDVNINTARSVCVKNKCFIAISGGSNKHFDIYVSTLGSNPSYSFEAVKDAYLRLIISSKRKKSEQFCMVLHPHYGNVSDLKLHREGNICAVTTGNEARIFRFDPKDHTLGLYPEPGVLSSPSPRPTPSISPTANIIPISSPIATSSATLSPTPTVISGSEFSSVPKFSPEVPEFSPKLSEESSEPIYTQEVDD